MLFHIADNKKQSIKMYNEKPFLQNYRLLRLPIVDEAGKPEWPQLFPIEKIDELRNTVGERHFSAQMMLQFMDETKARLDPGALHFYDAEFDARVAKINSHIITGYACYWDPSGGRSGADNSVCVMLYRDDKNKSAFIHDVVYLRTEDNDLHPLASQCEKVLDFMKLHNVKVIGIEVNGMGNALPEIMRETAQKKGQSAVVKKIINHQRKEVRILDSLEPLLSTGRLFSHVRTRSTPLLLEMLAWTPVGNMGHDDGLDAVAGGLRMQPTPLRPSGQYFRPMNAKTEFVV